MSLGGNLEDLSLGDILQIISLSQKSGVLVLESDQGVGRIVFRGGLVQAASIKGWPDDLRGILVGGGFLDSARFEAAQAQARARETSLEEVLARESGLGRVRLDALVRETVESAILEMFLWARGEFRFDMRSEAGSEDPKLVLETGLNAQYLAMEGMRLRDERSARLGRNELLEEGILDLEEIVLEEPGEEEAADRVVATVLEREPSDAESPDNRESAPRTEPRASARPVHRSTPVVLIDPDICVLEWAKLAIGDDFTRVHVFQQTEQGLARIRQYLVRGERPLVLISAEARVDPLSGIHGLADFVKRLKAQAPGLRVLGVREPDETVPPAPAGVEAVLARPARRELRQETELGGGETGRAFSAALAEALAAAASR
jgi:hypothetical protein